MFQAIPFPSSFAAPYENEGLEAYAIQSIACMADDEIATETEPCEHPSDAQGNYEYIFGHHLKLFHRGEIKWFRVSMLENGVLLKERSMGMVPTGPQAA